MNKKVPDTPDDLNEGSLDEYGVWVKAGPDDQDIENDEFVSDVLDDPTEDNHASPREMIMPFSLESDMLLQEPETGSQPERGIIQKGQEVENMSEKDKTKNASLTNDTTDENEISLDSADELALSSADDDLGGLSDLLLNIDEENDEDDTIYLEDDDLSFDLDQENEDLLLEQETDSQSSDDFDEDIVIPGLDDEFNIESDGSGEGLDLLNESLDALEETSLFEDPLEIQTEETSSVANLEIHGVEEVGLDDFLDEQITIDDTDEEMSLDEPSVEESHSVGIENNIELDEEASGVLGTSLEASIENDMDIDLGPEISLDDESFAHADSPSIGQFTDLEIEIDEPRPGKSKVEDEPFDDVAAFTDEIGSSPSKVEPSSPASSRILMSIEEELHAIRSELTDLRSELKKLRGKDDHPVSAGSSESPEEVDSDAMEAAQNAGGGFFDDDEDETIALTGDELDNILNTADFTEEAGEPSSLDPDEETGITESEEPNGMEVPVSASEFSFSDAIDKTDEGTTGAFEDDELGSFPPIEEINLEEIENLGEPHMPSDGGIDSNQKPQTGEFDNDALSLEDGENAVAQLAQLDIEKELAGIEDLKDEDDDIELYTGGELDSLELEIPEDFESVKPEQDFDNGPDASLDELDEMDLPVLENELEDIPESTKSSDNDVSFSLKQEIKAVLAYMDQLLESLPEEKIEEFAKSEHFDVYKKLFDELGL